MSSHAPSNATTGTLSREGIRNTIAGAVGGVACTYVGHPFDTVKVRMQTTHTSNVFKGPIDCLVTTMKSEGIRGLFAGVTPSCAAQVTENSILFMAYAYCQRFVRFATDTPDGKEMSLISLACCGGLAACFSTLGLTPTELIKCRLQVQKISGSSELIAKVKYNGPIDCAVQIVRSEGPQGLFRGLSSTLLREVPGNFAMFGGFELGRRVLTPEGQSVEDLSPFRTMLAGAFGGVALWSSIYPIDVIKSRIQVSTSKLSVAEAFRQVIKTDGIRGLYNGFTPCVARAFPACAALFLSVDLTKKFFDVVGFK